MAAEAPRELRLRIENIGAWRVRLTSYRLGDRFYCTADNVDPGGIIARTEAATREAAEAEALQTAQAKLATTRVFR